MQVNWNQEKSADVWLHKKYMKPNITLTAAVEEEEGQLAEW